MDKKLYQDYINILKEELVPAMGCTEPISIAYASAKAREILGCLPTEIEISASGNIIKNVKSVVVPNTDGLQGLRAAVVAGIVAGKAEKTLEVISQVSDSQKTDIRRYLESTPISITSSNSCEQLDICVTVYGDGHKASVRIAGLHTNIVLISKDDNVLYRSESIDYKTESLTDRSCLTLDGIIDFADSVNIDDVAPILRRQIQYNKAISEEGLKNRWGACIGQTIIKVFGDDVRHKAMAWAAAGSDARMSGCGLPVIINSGSGNQGMTASLPVLAYAEDIKATEEQTLRALIVSNLNTIHLKTGIGRLSAYCGAVSAGCGAACGIAYLLGADRNTIAQTLINADAVVSGIICDGAKASCAGKIATAVSAGILGYEMSKNGNTFKSGEGIVGDNVEKTIDNIGRLGRIGMKDTDKEIINIMLE